MAKAVKYPLCHGTGKEKGKYGRPALNSVGRAKICHGCGGKGWVEVSDK